MQYKAAKCLFSKETSASQCKQLGLNTRSDTVPRMQEMLKTHDKKYHQEEYGFHGTSEWSIQQICKEGFKHPDELEKMSKKKKGKPAVELLDDGYFGSSN